MLNCNCASTMLLMMFFAKLLDKSQTPAKSTYLWNMFQRISAEATAQAWHCWTPCPHFAAEWNGLGSARLSFLSTCFSSGILEKGLGQHVLRRSCARPLARRTCVFGCARFCPQCCEGPSIQKHATLEKPELDCSATIANHFLPDFAWSYGPQHFGACRSKRNFRESSSFTTTVRPRKEVGCWVRLVSAFMSPGASFHLKSIGNCSIITIVK